MFGRVVLGLFMVAAGFFMVWKTQLIYGWVGRIPSAEKYIGPGGSRFLLKVIGVVIVFFGFTTMFNLNEAVLEVTLGRWLSRGQ